MYFKSEKKIYVIVGEESGENIADILLSSLKKYIKFKLYGIGGQKLENKGLKSLFPFTELSIFDSKSLKSGSNCFSGIVSTNNGSAPAILINSGNDTQ